MDPNVEVIGDRCSLRFLRAHGDIEVVCHHYRKFLVWRVENDMDRIRRSIVFGPYSAVSQFSHAEKILKNMPQTICDTNMLSKSGMPVSFLACNFSMSDVMQNVSIEEYSSR